MVGLREAADREIGDYSKGMQRRIGIAQALIHDPDLIILDEPTNGLDPLGVRQVKDWIEGLKERGKTILISSHLLADVEQVCDRVSILYGGKVQAEGAAEEILERDDRTFWITSRPENDFYSTIVISVLPLLRLPQENLPPSIEMKPMPLLLLRRF